VEEFTNKLIEKPTELNFCPHDKHHQWTCCYWSRSLSNGRCGHQTTSRHGSCPAQVKIILNLSIHTAAVQQMSELLN